MVNGEVSAIVPHLACVQALAGMGFLLEAGEQGAVGLRRDGPAMAELIEAG